jgi:Leucine-rich repeat (LRR) protein
MTKYYDTTGIECVVQGLVITERNQIVTSVNNQAVSYYNSKNIKGLNFEFQSMNFMPKGLEKLFPQIELISIERSKLKEIRKEDLAPYPMLKKLWIQSNDLETLPSNLLEGNPELSIVSFFNNKLRFVGENILSPLKKLTWVYFRSNTCISMDAYTKAQISALTAELQSKCKSPQEKIKELELIIESQKKKIIDLNLELEEIVCAANKVD